MAQTTIIELTDDLDGSKATQTIPFSVNGTSYLIDLNNKNAKTFRETFAPFIQSARKSTAARRPGPARRNPNLPVRARAAHLRDVRAWAKRQGLHVSGYGRVPEPVMAKYDAAHRD